MTTTIILEDEPKVGNELKRMLESHFLDIKVAALCYDIEQAEAAIKKFNPDLVFLDIELNKSQTSFDLLKKISPVNFEIIFTTSYERYVVQAIKISAIDYLLKPIDEAELKTAIEKFRSKTFKVDLNKIESFLTAWTNPGSQQNKTPVPTMTGYDLITVADIIYCEGVGSQTLLVLKDNKKNISSMMLKEFDDILTPYNFFRIHKSHLINLAHVKKYLRSGTAIMSNGAELSVSRSFKEKFVEMLRNSKNS